MYLYLCTERSEVRVTMHNSFVVSVVVCGMMMKGMEKLKSGAGP